MTLRLRLAIGLTLVLYWIALTSCGGDAGAASPSDGAANGSPSAIPVGTETPNNELANEDNHGASGSPKNVVQVVNKSSKKLRMKANVQLNRIKGDSVTPLNAAVAVGQDCTGCQTFAVALQIDLYQQGAHVVSPENYAIALNLACTSCVTVAHAIQYAIPVTDPENDSDESEHQGDAKALLKQMEKELDAIAKTDGITPDEAERRIEGVLAQFRMLANTMLEDMKRTDATDSPSPSPLPSATGSGAPASAAPGSVTPASAPPTTAPSPTPSATASP
jgi:hypothetical protein